MATPAVLLTFDEQTARGDGESDQIELARVLVPFGGDHILLSVGILHHAGGRSADTWLAGVADSIVIALRNLKDFGTAILEVEPAGVEIDAICPECGASHQEHVALS